MYQGPSPPQPRFTGAGNPRILTIQDFVNSFTSYHFFWHPANHLFTPPKIGF